MVSKIPQLILICCRCVVNVFVYFQNTTCQENYLWLLWKPERGVYTYVSGYEKSWNIFEQVHKCEKKGAEGSFTSTYFWGYVVNLLLCLIYKLKFMCVGKKLSVCVSVRLCVSQASAGCLGTYSPWIGRLTVLGVREDHSRTAVIFSSCTML